MTQRPDFPHVYERDIRDDERTSLSVLAGLTPRGATVLDLGTGSGALGRHLTDRLGCVVDGVTFNAAEAAQARPHYRQLEVADLESCDLVALFGPARYDAIVCADVLEHLRDPARILEAARTLLAPGGRVLISIPNAAYCGLIGELLLGEFRYREEGLLDNTHLRFFTRRSLAQFLRDCGWALNSIEEIRRELPSSEFRVAFDSLPPAVSRYLLTRPDALTYQFIASAQPGAHHEAALINVAPGPQDGEAQFTAELYVGLAGTYREDRKVIATGTIGQAHQTLRFDLHGFGAFTQLRLDPADRPGFLRLYAIRLLDGGHAPLWQWDGAADGIAALTGCPHQQMLLSADAFMPDGAMLLLHGDDPWIELPVDPHIVERAAALEVVLGWPMSADYLALANTVQPLVEKVDVLQERVAAEASGHAQALEHSRQAFAGELEQTREGFAEERGKLSAQLRQTEAEGARVTQSLDAARAQRSQLAEQNRLLQQHRRGLNAELHALRHSHQRLVGEFTQLADHLRWIEQSTVFRATRPLVEAKMRVGRWLAAPTGARGAASTSDAAPAVQNAHPPTIDQLPPTPPSRTVDVIVPVYRGLADTRCCIESVLANACRTPLRLIVINDASPEPEITDYLCSLRTLDVRIVLLENEQNLGFVATVNRGMSLSDENDVVLLNSDAEVANDWLDRMVRAAYCDDRIASVTPFSNNATICSYPKFCADNDLPADEDTASLDRIFAATNAGQVADVPTGIGFCMLIRRDCLNEVGLFDVENFGKGYGEENDFCIRAEAAGWRNLHALDTFVRHAGGVSFGAGKSPREKAAMETLRRLHPRYEADVHRFIADDPARMARQAVDLARVQARGLPVVLAVMHDRQGGTLRHVGELAHHLRDIATFFMLVPTPGGVTLKRAEASEAFALMFKLPGEFDDLLDALRALDVRHLHFHHLLGHGPEVLSLPDRLGLPFDFTAHDFYTLCPQISLTGKKNRYCGEEGIAQCTACLQDSPAPGDMDIVSWRELHGAFLVRAQHVLAPSRDAARRMARYFPEADVRFAPHTDVPDAAALPVAAPVRQLAAGQALKIAVIGAMSPIKGADLLEDVAVEAARGNALLDFHLIGYGYRNLRTRPKSALTVYGQYEDDELPAMLEWLQPDLVWFPAQWPETYSYTLSACLQAGLPIVAPQFGAFPERLSGRPWSWVRPWDDMPAQWVKFFNEVRMRNFMEARPPAPVWAMANPADAQAHALDALVGDWDYRSDYLPIAAVAAPLPAPTAAMASDLASTTASQAFTTSPAASHGMTHAFMAAHQIDRRDIQGPVGAHARRGMLRTLIRLRSAPGLRDVARAIPLRWQTRIKTWLKA